MANQKLFTSLIKLAYVKSGLLALSLLLALTACSEYTAKGAAEGATAGAASGAVGGLVSALIFGGDPVDAAARGAVYGGAVGATAGGISGSQVDKQVKKQRAATEASVRTKIGDDAFFAVSALVRCDYKGAIDNSERAKQASNPNFSVAGYWVEVLSRADQGKTAEVEQLMPVVVSKDWDINNTVEAGANLMQLQKQLHMIREEYKLPVNCPST